MLGNALKDHQIILGSGSPRRQQLLTELGLDFKVRSKEVEEVYPEPLQGHEISDFLAQLKAKALLSGLRDTEILITADTVVWHKGKALGKPVDAKNAFGMLRALSGESHEVISSVCFTTTKKQTLVNATTQVSFKELTDEEIWFYIKNHKPFDKAGGYGIQEWIGLIGISEIKGSYTNVVGLPTHLVYKTLIRMVD